MYKVNGCWILPCIILPFPPQDSLKIHYIWWKVYISQILKSPLCSFFINSKFILHYLPPCIFVIRSHHVIPFHLPSAKSIHTRSPLKLNMIPRQLLLSVNFMPHTASSHRWLYITGGWPQIIVTQLSQEMHIFYILLLWRMIILEFHLFLICLHIYIWCTD